MIAWVRRNWPELLEVAMVSALAIAVAAVIWLAVSEEIAVDEHDDIDLMETQTGLPRFTYGDTNLPYVDVIVDNETGVRYLCRSKYGITPLLSSDGTPSLAAEAGD